MNPLDFLLGQVSNSIREHASPNTPGPTYDANPLINVISGLFGNFANQHGQPFNGNVQPASQDPYGDPGAGGGNALPPGTRPASEDPYGDPG